MATRRCPRCNLINPGSTTVCDCGWSFVDQAMTEPRHLSESSDQEDDRSSRSSRQITTGAVFLVLGIIITAVTFGLASSSPSGGTFVIAYGPMVYGAITLIRGLASKNG